MIQVQDWLKRTDTELELTAKYFQNLIDKIVDQDVTKKLHDAANKIERDYIPAGQKLRDEWKEKNKHTYNEIKIHLSKLHLAALAVNTVRSLI